MNNIHPTAIIYPNVELGDNITIGAYCIIGAPPENKATWGQPSKGVLIADNTIITGHCTIDAGVYKNTVIGFNCFIMKGVHIGHDSLIGANVTISPHVVIGGHCTIWNNVNMGIGSMVHQKCEVAEGCMIGMGAVITKKTQTNPNCVYVGSPARYLRENKYQKHD